MTQPTLEDLARQAAAGDAAASEVLVERLQAVFRLMDEGMLRRVLQSAAALSRGASAPLTPELLAWASQDLNEQEIVADLREVREKGGLALEDMLPELERIVERP